jgi:hypothetical protein
MDLWKFWLTLCLFSLDQSKRLSFCCRRVNWMNAQITGWHDNCYQGKWNWTTFDEIGENVCYSSPECSSPDHSDVPSSFHYMPNVSNVIEINQPCNSSNVTVHLESYSAGTLIPIQAFSRFTSDYKTGYTLTKFLYSKSEDQVSESHHPFSSSVFKVCIPLLIYFFQ